MAMELDEEIDYGNNQSGLVNDLQVDVIKVIS